ncbi:class I SAM-dependent methyltransferase [Methylobacterium sp. sgz302541]|uniref:class I SAM-dependent methyltransferase n=1 Tax=unclassified Methylobacterium TaxID=2615210 RepID=UPI003D32E7D2
MDRRQKVEPLSWNSPRGNAWADLQPMLDRLFRPFEDWIADCVADRGARDVLDVGCGAGATSLAIARRLEPGGCCTGIDISSVLVEIARRRIAETGLDNVRFLAADAQRHDFAGQRYDAVVSRFGVMFFDDPLEAFANIAGAVRPGGTLHCAVWRGPADNPFMTTADRAVPDILGAAAPPDPHAPGQFAFADAQRVETLLAASGWDGIEIQPLDLPCTLAAGDLSVYARRMGRVGMILPTLDEAARREAEARLDQAFAPFVAGGTARFNAACWNVSARKRSSD